MCILTICGSALSAVGLGRSVIAVLEKHIPQTLLQA